jgi:hypothetical protein
VLVQINESRCYDQPSSSQDLRAGQSLAADASHFAIGYSDITYGIQAGFRVHDPAAFNHDVIVFRTGAGRQITEANTTSKNVLTLVTICELQVQSAI